MHLAMVQTLHQARGSPEFPQIPLTVLCGIDAERVVSRPVLDSTPFAPTKGLHFQALLPLRFLFICNLHWCNECTGLEVAPNFRKFPLTALCGVHAEVHCRPVHDVTSFAPIEGSHFQALLPFSFFHINLAMVRTLHLARGSPELPQISIHGAMRN